MTLQKAWEDGSGDLCTLEWEDGEVADVSVSSNKNLTGQSRALLFTVEAGNISKQFKVTQRAQGYSFPVFDKVYELYPTYYKYILKDFNGGGDYIYMLVSETTGTGAAILLKCSWDEILYTEALPDNVYYHFGGVCGEYVVVMGGTSQRGVFWYVYKESDLTLVRSSGSLKNYATNLQTLFACKIGGKTYFEDTTNSGRNTPAVYCCEDDTIVRNEGTYHVFTATFKTDENGTLFYEWRQSPSYLNNVAAKIYKCTTMNGPKDFTTGLIYEGALTSSQNVIGFPRIDYKQGDVLDCYFYSGSITAKVWGGIDVTFASDGTCKYTLRNSVTWASKYSPETYGMLNLDGKNFYTMNYATKKIELVTIE